MSEPRIAINFGAHSDHFHARDLLAGNYRVEHFGERELVALELSVLWRTEGKGDEDIGVHHFQRIDLTDNQQSGAANQLFNTLLPNSPLSYDGAIVKIGWCVRVRAFFHDGQEVVHDRRFYLGNVRAPQGAPAHESRQVLAY